MNTTEQRYACLLRHRIITGDAPEMFALSVTCSLEDCVAEATIDVVSLQSNRQGGMCSHEGLDDCDRLVRRVVVDHEDFRSEGQLRQGARYRFHRRHDGILFVVARDENGDVQRRGLF
jgi:endonuclease YncB( thermonuclease family)